MAYTVMVYIVMAFDRERVVDDGDRLARVDVFDQRRNALAMERERERCILAWIDECRGQARWFLKTGPFGIGRRCLGLYSYGLSSYAL